MLIPHLYRPRDYQIPFYNSIADGFLRAVAIWHRRSGKDITCFNLMIKEAFKRIGAYFYFFPTYSQGRKTIWEGFDYAGKPFLNYLPPGSKKNESEMKIWLPSGSLIRIIGTDNFDSIVGPNPIGCVFSEFALQDPQAWDLVRPILAENRGWALFPYTPRGKNHGWDIYQLAKKYFKRWFLSFLTVDDTRRPNGKPVITEADIQKEREDGMSEDMILQEFFCDFFMGIEGAYYARIMNKLDRAGHFVPNLYDPALVVKTAWDLGVSDACSIWWFQQLSNEIRVIDYYENVGEGIEHYAQVLENKRQEHGYIYSPYDHFAPHDVEAREKFSGRSLKDQAKDIGLDFTTIPRDVNIQAGIETVRGILPRCWFDDPKTDEGKDGIVNYRKEYNKKTKEYSNRPLHDWASHPADAFRTLANAIRLGKTEKKGMSIEEVRELDETCGPPSARAA